MDHHYATEKQPAKADYLSVAFLNAQFNSHLSVHNKQSNLLLWAITLIFGDPITSIS